MPKKKPNPKGKTKEKKQARAPKQVRTVEAEIVTADNLPTVKPSSAPVPSDPLQQYLARVREYPLLTKEEEYELAVRYHETGDPIAAERLVTANLRFVIKVAAEYAKMGTRLMDLIQEGNVGLMHAVKEFNPYKGVRLISYAVWWIRGYIREYLLKQHSMVKIGTTQNQKKLFYNLKKEQQKLLAEGKPAGVKEISEHMDLPEKDVELMMKRMHTKDISLDQPLTSADDSATLMDLQETPEDTDIEGQLETLELLDILNEKVEEIKPKLNEKELYILENRILADTPMTLQEIGDEFGITRERTRQLESRLLKNLKELFLQELPPLN